MQTVDLSEYIVKQEVRKNDFELQGHTRIVPKERIVKDHLGDGRYKVLLCTFNELSFQGQCTFLITEELLASEMDKMLDRHLGELEQSDVFKRKEATKNVEEFINVITTINLAAVNGTLESYEIVKEGDSEVINLYGVVKLNDRAVKLVESIPHYLSIRSLGLMTMKDGKNMMNIKSIHAFDLEAALF
jgi:hypothetical protein